MIPNYLFFIFIFIFRKLDINKKHAFHFLKRRLRPHNRAYLNDAVLKAWSTITNKETKNWVNSMGHSLDAIVAIKQSILDFILIKNILFQYFSSIKK